jgi:hypothetical protein
MSSEREANLAREEHADYLRRLGAHAIAVDEVKQDGDNNFGVIAFFEEKPDDVPHTLEVKHGRKTLKVPLVARVQEKFKPESAS